jgi:thiol-disulfide isomerase/thioredoxin
MTIRVFRGLLVGLAVFCLGGPAFAREAPLFASYEATRHSDGEEIALADFAGSPVILMLFFPNCHDCKQELQMFEEIREELDQRGVVLVPLTRERFNPRLVSKTLKDLGVEHLEIYYDHMPGLFERIPVRNVPHLMIFDASGKIVHEEKGLISELLLEEILDDIAPRKGE